MIGHAKFLQSIEEALPIGENLGQEMIKVAARDHLLQRKAVEFLVASTVRKRCASKADSKGHEDFQRNKK